MSIKPYLFLFVCIPVRLLFVYLVKDVIPKDDIQYASIPLFIIFIGFMLAQRYRTTAMESSGEGGHIWWHNIRPVHAMLYLWAATSALCKPKDAWIPLLIDVIFGLLMYIVYKCKLDPNGRVISLPPTSTS